MPIVRARRLRRMASSCQLQSAANQASDRAFEMRRNGANHIIGSYGPERLLPHVAVTVSLSSVTSTRATRLLSKIHQRTFISRRTGGRHGARTARDEGQLSAHL